MLVDKFHWPPNDLAKADIDMVLPLIVYYPYWKSKTTLQPKDREENEVFCDEVDFL